MSGGRNLPVTSPVIIAALVVLAVLAHSPTHAAGEPGAQRKSIQFAKGSSASQVRGSVKGDADVEYTINARAGQTLAVALSSTNGSLSFNILPPGSRLAMFNSSVQGAKASVVLPADGTYSVVVYLMRNASRRNESASYELDVAVTGQAIPPLAGGKDALIAGTQFHASASVPCQMLGLDPGARCEAFVTRRGRDGTATVEVRAPNSVTRRVLFVQGKPVAADSPEALTSTRQGDLVKVRIGADESFDVVDAFLTGG